MKEHNVVAISGREIIRDKLTELIRAGARELIAEGLEAEVGELLVELVDLHPRVHSNIRCKSTLLPFQFGAKSTIFLDE